MLVVLAAVGLARLVPLLGVGATACLHAAPSMAPAGIHLGLLSRSDACPQHTYAPGVTFSLAVHVGVLALVVALEAASIALLRALGGGPWMLSVLASIRRRLGSRLVPLLPVAVAGVRPPVAPAPVIVPAGIGEREPLHRRGPPQSC